MKHEMIIGKYTLESITNGLYASPLDMYREYIQNSVDAIDNAIQYEILSSSEAKIEIRLDSNDRNISIRDNGSGIPVKKAINTLIDIGNSKKTRVESRGFRGIGRLSGLGYCDKLIFTTSSFGENIKTEITFDAQLLRQLLIIDDTDDSIFDIIDKIVSIKTYSEKVSAHYFCVDMFNVTMDELISHDTVKTYLKENAPIPFSPDFIWGDVIVGKFKSQGFTLQSYNIDLIYDNTAERLYKPYSNTFISDRIKKVSSTIKDIETIEFKDANETLGYMWYAKTDYNGSLLDNAIKGIRFKQGNILIGNKNTCSQYFKEERFNGWLIGELHLTNPGFIPNSRRDHFEKNDKYFLLEEFLKNFSSNISKAIRHLSQIRNLNKDKVKIIEEDTNDLMVEDWSVDPPDEFSLLSAGDVVYEAENDYYEKLSIILGNRKRQTKYSALNAKHNLTIDQRKTLEKVFDIIVGEFPEDEAKALINSIINKY